MPKVADTGVDAALHAEWVEARDTAFPDPAEINMFRDYARGVQKLTLTSHHTKWLRGLRMQFCKNILDRILTVITDRITFKNFVVSNEAVRTYLQGLVVFNAFDLLAAQVIYQAWRDGNAAMSLAFDDDDGRVIITRERWWNGEDGIFIAYDSKGRQVWSLLEWQATEGLRRTYQSATEVRRYLNKGKGWEWYTGDGHKPEPFKTLDSKGKGIGLMVVHFARKVKPADARKGDKGNQRDANYGVSIFANGLIGLQDVLNDTLKMIASAARFTAFQILFAAGVEQEDPKKTKKTIEPGEMLTSTSPDTKFGAIAAGSISELIVAKESWQADAADSASVPVHTIKGAWPSGEALFRSESPLIDQCRKGGISLAPAFASVGHKATVLENTYNGQNYDTKALIGAAYYPPERYDPLTLTQLANLRRESISLREYHRLCGYSEEQSAQIIQEMGEDRSFVENQTPGQDDDLGLVDDAQILSDASRAELARLAADELVNGLTAPTSPTDPLPQVAGIGNPADAGTQADNTLNGAQITAAISIFNQLLGVGDGITITRLVALELLVAVGIERTTAAAMVDDTLANKAKATATVSDPPANTPPTPPAAN